VDFQVEYVHSADGTNIAMGRGGSGAPLLVVPYMAGTIETTWSMCADAFPDYELVTYDRRGTGLSARGVASRDPQPYFDDVQAVLDTLDGEVAVLGTLLGTIEAAWLAAHNADRITKLVLRSPLMNMADWASIPGVRAGLAALEHDWDFFTEAFSQFVVGWGKPQARQLAARYRSVTTKAELRALFDAFATIDLERAYPSIAASTLVEHHPDYFFPNTYSQRIASAIPTSKVVVFRGSDFINDLGLPSAFLSKGTSPSVAPGGALPGGDHQAVLAAALKGRYEIEGELGAGGMALVYRARDIRHERQVAIKVLRPDLAAAIGAERFFNEIRVTANLQHPHILSLFDSGSAGSLLYYVMPFIEGESLRGRLDREQRLDIVEAVRIVTEAAGALDHAHHKGIVHRDIKPENILLHDGRVLVADFGIALAARADGARLTGTGVSIGTPQYMSPEQAAGERDVDGRTDVYGLGCVLYEMLCGEPPFGGPSIPAIVAKVLTAQPVPVRTLRPTVPDHVAAAVMRSLEKSPADRFATAGAFAEALEAG
jgi:pimeloyl-ACP methyl ester carboxylesterase/predicted Ser/Thr protein kinase